MHRRNDHILVKIATKNVAVWVQPPERTVRRFLKKSEIGLPCDGVVPLLGIWPEEARSLSLEASARPTFTAALCITAKTWKRHRRPRMDEWIKGMCYLHMVEYYSATERKEILSATEQTDLEGIMLSDTRQIEKDKYCVISRIRGI